MSNGENWAQRADEWLDNVFYKATDWLAPERPIDPEYAAQLAAIEQEQESDEETTEGV